MSSGVGGATGELFSGRWFPGFVSPIPLASLDKTGICAAFFKQLPMGAYFSDAAFLQYNDPIGFFHSG